MKKLFLSAVVILLAMSSCNTMKKTATSVDVANSISTQTSADLEVSGKRIVYTFRPTKAERKSGSKGVQNAAVAAALRANDNSDVLVAPEFETRIRHSLFGSSKITEITVMGYPAKYKNFKSKK